jgi:hypothetical protein
METCGKCGLPDPGTGELIVFVDSYTLSRTCPCSKVVQFPKTPVGLEREGWDIPPEAA